MSSISVLSENLPPLAERIRPQILRDFIGQREILHADSLISKSVISNQPFSLIFWGPPGTGKTTLARILSYEYSAKYYELSAVASGVKNIREILEKGKAHFNEGTRTILFIDEIHHFSKSQQDALLHAVEDGSIILMGATTENPSFEVITPLLSRCQVIRLRSLNDEELKKVVARSFKEDILLSKYNLKISKESLSLIIKSCGGDARKLLNSLELAISMLSDDNSELTSKCILEAIQKKQIIYDKDGDYHYDVISAFIKSIRGSDPDASVYWLAVMLEGGEKPEFIARRLIILASEDIGNAEPYALQLSTAAFDAVHKVGMPESQIILSQITTYLAAAPKSNSAYQAINAARKLIKEKGVAPVPLHLRNAVTKLMKEEGYGKDYKYSHDYKNHFVKQNYFPETFDAPILFYIPGNEGREKFLKERLEKLWQNRYK